MIHTLKPISFQRYYLDDLYIQARNIVFESCE